jgi:hypothetical protein
MEGFTVLSGNALDKLKKELGTITEGAKERYGHFGTAHHEWINSIEGSNYRAAIETVRTSDIIFNKIRENFPGAAVKSVEEVDEVYWAVSPKDATGSDRALVDCHFDSPFGWFPTGGVVFYRIIIATNENNDVVTVFPGEDKRVKMSTGDFHGLDYNKDWHCVEGKIPPGKFRVLLKLHYLVTPPGSEDWEGYVRWMNVGWTQLSRETMRMSARPENWIEYVVAAVVNICRVLFNNTFKTLTVVAVGATVLLALFALSSIKSTKVSSVKRGKRRV